MKYKAVLLCAGHSDRDPGAMAAGFTEAEIVTDFRDRVAGYLQAAGVAVITDGPPGVNQPLTEAIALAYANPELLPIEFHCNAFSNPAASGVETLSGAGLFGLGDSLCDVISKVLGIPNRKAKPEGSGQHATLGFVRAGGIIVELFFITNPSDRSRFMFRRDDLAAVVALAIERYVGPAKD